MSEINFDKDDILAPGHVLDPVTPAARDAAVAATEPPEAPGRGERVAYLFVSLLFLVAIVSSILTVVLAVQQEHTVSQLQNQQKLSSAQQACLSQFTQAFKTETTARSVIAGDDRQVVSDFLKNALASDNLTRANINAAYKTYLTQTAANQKARNALPTAVPQCQLPPTTKAHK